MTCLNQIFEDRFIFEEGAYRAYVTDEKMDIDQKDIQTPFLFPKKRSITSAIAASPLTLQAGP